MTCEVTPHHFALTDEAVRGYDTNAKMNPPLRRRPIVGALLAALADGTIDAIATDHAPHNTDEKMVEFSRAPFGVVGLETAVSICLDRLVHAGVIGLRALGRAPVERAGLARLAARQRARLRVGTTRTSPVLDLERKVVDRSPACVRVEERQLRRSADGRSAEAPS